MGHIPAGVGAPTGVRVRLLGQPSVVAAGGEHPLGPDRRHQLLGYLAYRGDWVERSRLSALLWGELPEDAASRNLRQALQRVRKLPWVHGLEEEGRRLRWLVPTDLAAVRSALAAGADPDVPLGQLLDGLEGYESGPFADWLTFEREELWRELGMRPSARARELAAGLQEAQPAPTTVSPTNPPGSVTGAAPSPVGEFVGRERQLQALLAALAGGDRAVTITGPSGIGKTRLVTELLTRHARELSEAFPQGTTFVSLLEVVEARDVISVVARAAGAAPTTVPSVLAPQLDGRRLLVLDNAEHIPGLGAALGELLAFTPGLSALVTSHTRLGSPGERLVRLGGLDAQESLALFLARARRLEPGFHPDEDGLAAIGRACELVGHTPLGVELAASVAGSAPLEEVVRWL